MDFLKIERQTNVVLACFILKMQNNIFSYLPSASVCQYKPATLFSTINSERSESKLQFLFNKTSTNQKKTHSKMYVNGNQIGHFSMSFGGCPKETILLVVSFKKRNANTNKRIKLNNETTKLI